MFIKSVLAGTNTLQCVTACIALVMGLLPASYAADWEIDRLRSSLRFIATYDGIPFDGEFPKFNATMIFNSKDLQSSRFDATIDTTSVYTNSVDRDTALATSDWFHLKRYPTATFRTINITHRQGNNFEAQASITIRDNTEVIVLPFSWVMHGNKAHMHGEVMLKRTDFDIGVGEWAEDETIGFDVKVIVDVHLNMI